MPATLHSPSIPKSGLKRTHDLQDERLEALANLVGGPVPVLDLTQAGVRDALNDLARAMVIQFIGQRNLPPGRPLTARLSPQPSEMVIPVATIGSVPVKVAVAWTVLDAQQQPVPPGPAFVAPSGLTLPDVSLIFAPAIAPLPAPASATRQFTVRATVQLSLQLPSLIFGGTDGGFVDVVSDEVTLPPPGVDVPTVSVLPLEVPSLLLLFRHPNLAPRADDHDGFILIVAPDGFPEQLQGLGQIVDVFNGLGAALPTLASAFSSFAPMLPLASQLSLIAFLTYPNPVMTVASEIANLNQITMIDRPPLRNDIEAAQEASSLLLLGVEGAQVECFNHRNFSSGQGKLTLTTGPELHVIVRSLHSQRPRSEPVGRITVDVVPDRVGNRSFGDELVSLRFL
jgi:hypothetical protein